VKRVLFLLPTAWDAPQLEACRPAWEGRYEPVLGQPTDDSCTWEDDPFALLEAALAEHGGRIDGVLSSSDYPGATLAGALARQLGLPGSGPEAVIRTSHKYTSRVLQRGAVPQATPGFALVDPRAEDPAAGVSFPCYLKPVKGAFSIMSRRIDTPEELRAFVSGPAAEHFLTVWIAMFNKLVAGMTRLETNGSFFLAEELLHGRQVTVEGFCCRGEVEVFGIVDSVMHPGTGSFARFDYPSTLPDAVQARMADVTRRVIEASDLDDAMFNVELIHDPATDRLAIIEINPRIAGQFGDLYLKVDGRSSYEYALELATGERPRVRRGAGTCGAASSLPLRVFEPVRVEHAPDAADIAAVQRDFPGTLVWPQCAAGQELSDFERFEDGGSHRYAVINAGAADRAALDARLAAVTERLGWRLRALTGRA
jgi:biotin carboxylase